MHVGRSESCALFYGRIVRLETICAGVATVRARIAMGHSGP